MNIRKAIEKDLDRIMEIYHYAQDFMIEHGNPTQWEHIYPDLELLKDDIQKEQLFVLEDEDIHGVFAFIIGADPTYAYIENGKWLNDEVYGTIHRIASDGRVKGILEKAVAFGSSLVGNIRIDTHHDNVVMQNACAKNGFIECGVIYVADGSPRIAYQKTVSNVHK